MKLIILGTGGHAAVCKAIAHINGWKEVILSAKGDDEFYCRIVDGMFKNTKELEKYRSERQFFVGMGEISKRVEIWERFTGWGYEAPLLIGEYAVCYSAGSGTMFGHGAIAQYNAIIGKNCIINTGAIVEHGCSVGDHTVISPGATICGGCTIGERVYIGPGSTIGQGVSICDDAIIGAGAVVLRDITEPGRYYGVPAKYYGGKNVYSG